MSEIGNRVLLSRRDLGLDQQGLADLVSVSRPYISKIERGKAGGLSLEVVDGLAAALGVSPAYLLGFTDDPLAVEVAPSVIEEESVGYAGRSEVGQLLDVGSRLSGEMLNTLLLVAHALEAVDERTRQQQAAMESVFGQLVEMLLASGGRGEVAKIEQILRSLGGDVPDSLSSRLVRR